ncbi:MAG TPA: hypothetical protein PKJ42_06265, partial [Candidatus Goldiibacteriota bacterium]|nr:hypothetical protein [Candidatus Goldiibacteriota bacterium]
MIKNRLISGKTGIGLFVFVFVLLSDIYSASSILNSSLNVTTGSNTGCYTAGSSMTINFTANSGSSFNTGFGAIFMDYDGDNTLDWNDWCLYRSGGAVSPPDRNGVDNGYGFVTSSSNQSISVTASAPSGISGTIRLWVTIRTDYYSLKDWGGNGYDDIEYIDIGVCSTGPTNTHTHTYTATNTNTHTFTNTNTHTFTDTPTATPTATLAACAASDNFNDNSFNTSVWTATTLGTVSSSSQNETSSTLQVTVQTASDMLATGTSDNVRFIYQKIPSTTDFIMTVRITNISGGNPAGGGVVVRDSLNAGSEMYFMGGLYYDRPAYFKYRTTDGGSSSGTGTSAASFSSKYFMLVKNGNSIGGYYSTDNVTWTQQGVTQTASFDSDMYVGLDTSGAYSNSYTTTYDDYTFT